MRGTLAVALAASKSANTRRAYRAAWAAWRRWAAEHDAPALPAQAPAYLAGRYQVGSRLPTLRVGRAASQVNDAGNARGQRR